MNRHFMTFLIVIFLLPVILCDDTPACHAWSELETSIKLKIEDLNCTKNIGCTGMNCSGSIEDKKFRAGLQIYQCENPSYVVVMADAPSLGINNWQKSFISASTFDLSDNVKGELRLSKKKDNILISMSIHVISDVGNYFSKLLGKTLEFPIFTGATFPVLHCENTDSKTVKFSAVEHTTLGIPRNLLDIKTQDKPNGNCTIINSSCPKEESCVQLDKSSFDGICVCRSSYSRDVHGTCVYTPNIQPSEGNSSLPTPESHVTPPNASSGSVLRTALLVSVTTVFLLIGITYAMVKFKVLQRIRRRFRVQVYEQVLLGQQDDNDEPLTDPVA